MNGVTLVLCIHNHQPVGNLPEVFQDAYTRAYLPFLETIEQFPEIKIVLHNTGPLLEWYEEHAPDYIERVRVLVARGQVEVLGGAFYEPILCAIPERDARGQIRMMTDYVSDRFGARPRGMWLAERVWEPRLAKTIRESGMEYLPLDDYEFRLAGIEDDDLVGPFLVEEQGVAVHAFPISKRLRYAIPFADPDETLSILRSVAERGDGHVAVFGDDGEKFGVWPGTHAHVHVGGWLKRFLKLLSENQDWVKTATFAEIVDDVAPRGRAYLPTSSYPEMMEWALPTKARRSYERFIGKLGDDGVLEEWGPFVSGGTWKGFLSKYEESNLMVRKMMRVSDKIAAVRQASDMLGAADGPPGATESAGGVLASVDAAVLEEATRDLWRGQCNCAYWHGIFGGLYLPHLRTAIYDHLIRAERLIEEARGGTWDRAEIMDHDLDGRDEVLLESHHANVYVAPSRGGTIFELDVRSADWNALATMSRYDEAYHDDIPDTCSIECEKVRNIHDVPVAKEDGLTYLAGADSHPRVAAIDHFFARGARRSDIESGVGELGDFAWSSYEFELVRREDSVGVEMKRFGAVQSAGAACPVTLEKRVWLTGSGTVRVEYDLVPDGELDVLFAPEWNLSFLTPDREWVSFHVDGQEGSGLRQKKNLDGVTAMTVDDRLRGQRVSVSCEPAAGVWTWPLDTASHSEGGLERVFQGIALVTRWPVRAGRGERLSFGVEFEFPRLSAE
ncbi:MAG: alpha-amylase/4-alpha-glucanotransferase domain-containing protein [Candidatus Eisenbacteria bacterium]